MDDGKSAVLAIADALNGIRRDWIAGDNRMVELLSGGMKSSQGGFERLMSEERRPVNEALSLMRRSLIPAASMFLDPELKSDLRDFLEHLDTNGADDAGTLRWRLTWEQLALESQLQNHVSFIVSAARHTKQTFRANHNRRPGEERIIPHDFDESFRKPKVIRELCYSIAAYLPMIRNDWQEGDDLEAEWRAAGWPTAGDGFLREKRGSRYEVYRLLNKIVRDAGVVVFPFLDPDLRARLIRFCQAARPYEVTDIDGDRGERWHLRWEELNLDDEVVTLGIELRAVGDSFCLGSGQAQVPLGGSSAELPKAKPIRKPDGWTAKELRDECTHNEVNVSEERFRLIRESAGLPASPSGGGGAQRRFGIRDVQKLAHAAETGTFRGGELIAAIWRELAESQ